MDRDFGRGPPSTELLGVLFVAKASWIGTRPSWFMRCCHTSEVVRPIGGTAV